MVYNIVENNNKIEKKNNKLSIYVTYIYEITIRFVKI